MNSFVSKLLVKPFPRFTLYLGADREPFEQSRDPLTLLKLRAREMVRPLFVCHDTPPKFYVKFFFTTLNVASNPFRHYPRSAPDRISPYSPNTSLMVPVRRPFDEPHTARAMSFNEFPASYISQMVRSLLDS